MDSETRILNGIIKDIARESTQAGREKRARLLENVERSVQRRMVRAQGTAEQLLTAAHVEIVAAGETLSRGDFSQAAAEDALKHLLHAKRALDSI